MAELDTAGGGLTNGRERGESASEYQAYRVYRDLGPSRTLAAAWHAHRQTSIRPAKSRGRPRLPNADTRHPSGQWATWSSRGKWVERAADHDARVDAEKRVARLEGVQEHQTRRMKVQLAAQERLEELVWRIEARLDEVDKGPITGFTDWRREVRGKKVVETQTHVEGINLSAYASLVQQANETSRMAIIGVPVAYDEGIEDDFEPTNALRSVNSNVVLRPDRLPGEPARAYSAFRAYRDQGPQRSLRTARIADLQNGDKVPQSCRPRLTNGATRPSAGHWTAWSRQWNWVERAAAYDAMVDVSTREAQCYRVVEIEKRRLDFEIANQHRLSKRLEKIDALLIKAIDAPPVGFTRSTKRRWWDGSSVQTKTQITGLDIVGYVALLKQFRETINQSIVGVRPTHGCRS